MLCIKLRILTGRYHATPWGRNANEGVPEWPPSTFRLSRAIIDAWKRKYPEIDKDVVFRIMAALASESPDYWIPPANSSHLRLYLHQNASSLKKRFSKQKVFDPFIIVAPHDEVSISWPDVSLDDGDLEVLDMLLKAINYLGRSESWCDLYLGRCEQDPNCLHDMQEGLNEDYVRIKVAGLTNPRDYVEVKDRKKKSITWFDSLALSSKDIEKMGFDLPPSLQFHDYLMDPQCLGVRRKSSTQLTSPETREVLYRIEGKVSVPIGESVKVSEMARRLLMGIHSRIMGDPTKVSTKFSGKDRESIPLKGHVHCYFSPLDMDNDGFLDHLSIRCREPFTKEELLALDRLERLPRSGGHELVLTPIRTNKKVDKRPNTMVSRTPYVSPRHHRKGRGDFMEWMKAELMRDLKDAGLPEPTSMEQVPYLMTGRCNIQWFEFIRSRKNDTANYGFGFRLRFDEPVPEKFNVGYGAHYGLGLFMPEQP